ncbi:MULTISPECIES: hypothetical protein [unclassified Streptomyces]
MARSLRAAGAGVWVWPPLRR